MRPACTGDFHTGMVQEEDRIVSSETVFGSNTSEHQGKVQTAVVSSVDERINFLVIAGAYLREKHNEDLLYASA